MGVQGRDKFASSAFMFVPMAVAQLEAAYRSDWIARKVIDIPAQDSTRAWRRWEADSADIEQIEDLEKNFMLQKKMQHALKLARLYGGAALIIGADQGTPDQPLIVENIKKGQLKFIHAVSRWDLAAGPMISDILSPYYGEPEYYQRNAADASGLGSMQKIHPSRVVRLVGAELPDRQRTQEIWGDSILQIVNDAVTAASTVSTSIATLISEAKIDIIKIPKLTEILSTKSGEQKLSQRFSAANVQKSIINTLLLDAEEEWQRIQVAFAGMPDTLQMYLLIASGAADIPATRLLGQSPAGMNATGDSDTRNYYDRLHSEQNTTLTPALTPLDEVMIRSALGARDPSIFYIWNSLWQLDEQQRTTMVQQKAASFQIDVNTGLFPDEVLRDARINQLIEDGTYPGLEQIIEEFEAAQGPLEEFMNQQKEAALVSSVPDPNAPADPNNPNAPPNPNNPPSPANSNTPPPKKSASPAGDARFLDAEPRTLYVRRDVLNKQDIIKWAKEQGFTTTVPADELHVTLIYSRTPMDWTKISEAYDQDENGEVHVAPGGPRSIEKFGEGATVLAFASTCLQWRHCDLKMQGATSDYDSYVPHITISYDYAGSTRDIEPYQGPIDLGPEIFEEVKGFDPTKLVET
jgi:phage-related protein (TIGR01555 family)